MKDLYTENYKIDERNLIRPTNGKTSCVHRLGKLILLKCLYYPK